jgi:hypothetical protein
MAARQRKIEGLPEAAEWLEGRRLWVVGWRKVGPRGKRKLWEPRVVEACLTADGSIGWSSPERPES